MDLLTLLTVCSLGFDPKLMQGIAIVQSGGTPYVYKMEERITQFDGAGEVIAAARARQEEGKKIRIGLMGLDVDLLAATAEPNEAMFEPCVNINIASRNLAGYKEICEREGSNSPESCAVMSYMGAGYQEQDESHLDFIMTGALTGNLPNPEIKGISAPAPRPSREEPADLDTGPIFFDESGKEGINPREEQTSKDSLFFD